MQRYEHNISSHMLEPHVKGPWMLYETAAARIRELQIENKTLGAQMTQLICELSDMIGECDNLRQQLAAAQEREAEMLRVIGKAQSMLVCAESSFLPASSLADEHRELVAELRNIQTKWRELPQPPEADHA